MVVYKIAMSTYFTPLATTDNGDGQRVRGGGEQDILTHGGGGSRRRRRGAWAKSLPEAFSVMGSKRH